MRARLRSVHVSGAYMRTSIRVSVCVCTCAYVRECVLLSTIYINNISSTRVKRPAGQPLAGASGAPPVGRRPY